MHKYSLFFIALLSLLQLSSCVKSTDSDDDLVGNWVRRSDFEGKARTEAIAAVASNGSVYIGLGFDGTNRLLDFWEYNSEQDAWFGRDTFPGTGRTGAISFSVNNKVYVGLGHDGVNYLNDLWEYDPADDSWERKADCPSSGRSGATAFAIGDLGYICSGYDGNYLKDFWSYNPSSNEWTKLTSPLGSKRNEAVVFVIDNKAYLATGINNGEYVSDFYVYDPSTQSWQEKRRIINYDDDLDYDDDYSTIVRQGAVAFSVNGKGYITTGISSSSYLNNTWEYDPATDTWTERTGFEGTGREGAIGFSVNNRAFVGLGKSSSLRFDNFLEFLPTAEYEEND